MTAFEDPERDATGEQPDFLREAAERLGELGPAVLSDAELVTILIGSGVAASRLSTEVNLRRLQSVPIEELTSVRGIGPKQARKLLAAAELGRRLWPDGDSMSLIRGPESIYELCRDVRTANREHFIGFYLNSRNQVLRREIVSIGSLNASLVHPREVFVPAIALSAASLILAHNHPSGDATPSEEDLAITRRLQESGRLLGIELLDHIIVCRDSYTSFKERRLLRS